MSALRCHGIVMTMVTNIILVIGFVILGGVIWYLTRRPKDDDQGLLMLQQQMQALSESMDRKIGDSTKEMHQSLKTQLSESTKIVREVTAGLTKLDETNKQVVGFAEQLQSLQNVLQNPKQRGVLGEYYLESVLQNVLPPGRFQMQYKFSNGDIVDAAVFLADDKILPVDSKFSLENYNRAAEEHDVTRQEELVKQFKNDLKLRIDETAKYIRPQENTMEFAFMFIPSEGVYYDLLINKVGTVKTSARDLIEYAFQQKKVIIVSPTSFLAYLQTVMQGLRALHIEESAKEIRKGVEALGRHVINADDFMMRLGNSLSTTVNHFNKTHKELHKVGKDVGKITGGVIEIEPLSLEKPQKEEE